MPVTTVVAGLVVVVAAIIRYLFTLLCARRRLQQHASTGSIAIMLLFLCVSAFSLQTRNLLPLGVLLAVVLAASLGRGVAVIACRSQRALRLSTKSLAWTIGLSVVLVFTLAMSEVGGNKNIASTYWDPTFAVPFDRPGAWNKFAVGKRRIALGSRGSSVRLFEVSGDGQISFRTALDPVLSEVESMHSQGPIPVFDERDELFIISNADTWGLQFDPFRRTREPVPPNRVELCQAGWEDGTLGPRADISMPMLIPHEYAGAYDAAIDGEHLYVLYEFVPPRSPENSKPSRHIALAVFQLNEQRRPKVLRVSDLGFGGRPAPRLGGYHFSRGADGRIYAVGNWNPYVDPARLHGTMPDSRFALAIDSGFSFAPYMISPTLTCAGDRFAFTVHASLRPDAPKGLEVTSWGVTIGEAKASPWAWLFRSGVPILVSAGRGRVWEVHEGSAICYDVSDPHRPKRIAHVNSHRILNAASGPDFLLLDYGPGFSIVRHPPTSR